MKCDELMKYGMNDPTIGDDYEMYRVADVDAAIAELKTKLEEEREFGLNRAKSADHEIGNMFVEIKELKAENRELKRALWLARAKNASYNVKNRQRVINTELEQERPDIEFIHHHEKMKQKWMNVERLCLKKAEEYK